MSGRYGLVFLSPKQATNQLTQQELQSHLLVLSISCPINSFIKSGLAIQQTRHLLASGNLAAATVILSSICPKNLFI